MVRKIITDKKLIRALTNRSDNYLIVEYSTKYKRAWFQTESMPKRKPISLSRLTFLSNNV